MFARKALLYGFFALPVLVGPLIGCSSYSAHPVSANSRGSLHKAGGEPGRASSDHVANNEPLKLPLIKPRLEVWKADRKMLLFSDERIVRTYHIGLGLSPVGDKVRSGDHRTPEGEFYIFIKNPKSAFYLSLGISYPNLEHARRGLREGLITQGQYDQIAEAIKRKKGPPQNTKLGGLIYIHGNGSSTDWTWGCVALENEEVKELYEAVEVGTPVTIKP
jgi:hypothetical protein